MKISVPVESYCVDKSTNHCANRTQIQRTVLSFEWIANSRCSTHHARLSINLAERLLAGQRAIGVTGTLDGALVGASFGMMGGSLAAHFAVECFVAGTPVWVPYDEEFIGQVVVAGGLGPETTKWTWQHAFGLGLVICAGVGSLARLERKERHNRKRNYAVAEDAVFEQFQWSQEDPFGLEELACERLEVAERDRTRLAWL